MSKICSNFITTLFFALVFSFSVVQMPSAHAMKNRTIVLRAAGSGALLGLGAGVVSYPFAKSGSTLIAGAVVGALVGTVYGFYLIDGRDQAYRASGAGEVGSLEYRSNGDVDLAWAKNGKARASFEVGVPFAEFTFDIR